MRDEAVGDLLRRASVADLVRELGEGVAHRLGVERLVLLGPEDLREEIRDQLADHHVGVGDGERPAAAVARRAGIGAGRIRPDAEARAVEMQDRAAAGRDRVDQHHRRAHAHARDLGLEGALVLAVVMRHVGRGAAHVEADERGRSRPRAPVSAMPTTPPAGPDRIASLPWNSSAAVSPPDDIMNISRAPELVDVELGGHLRHVAAQDRREIGVDHRGVAAPDQLDQRRDLVAHRDLREAHLARERRDRAARASG